MPRRLATLAVALLLAAAPAAAQTARFRYRPERVPVGTVYHYTKSNLDGSNPWRLTTYVASRTRLDVIKWSDGPGQLVNVMAEVDWQAATAARVEQWNPRDGRMAMTMTGDLSLDGRSLTLNLANGQALTVEAAVQPVHVFGFDLQSLNMTYRHLDDPTRAFEVGLVGINRNPSPERPQPVVYHGRTTFEYLGEEQVRGAACRKYRMAGEGMDGKEGFVWFDRDAGHLVRAESPWPVSTDWTSYRLELNRVEQMTPFAWADFKAGVLAPHLRTK